MSRPESSAIPPVDDRTPDRGPIEQTTELAPAHPHRNFQADPRPTAHAPGSDSSLPVHGRTGSSHPGLTETQVLPPGPDHSNLARPGEPTEQAETVSVASDNPDSRFLPKPVLNEPSGSLFPDLDDLSDPPLPADRYAVVAELGRGGIGQVWEAVDLHLGRTVALKTLRPDRAGSSDQVRRFEQEALVTAQLEHPAIVPLHDHARPAQGKRPFYTMKKVVGPTLRQAVRDYHDRRKSRGADAVQFRTLLQAFLTVCQAVAYAHSQRILHRDLKGQNIVLGAFGEVFLLDWGLAKRLDHSDSGADFQSVSPDPNFHSGSSSDHTHPRSIVGTFSSMPPENASGDPSRVGFHSDVFGLGAVLYEILTGQPPLDGATTPGSYRERWIKGIRPARELNPDVHPALDAICSRALRPRPEDRFASADEMVQEMERWLAGEPVRSYREPVVQQAQRWVRKRWNTVVTVSGLLLTALVTLGIAYALEAQANLQAERDAAALRVSIRNGVAAVQRLVDISTDELSTVPGKIEARKYVLEQAQPFLTDLRRRDYPFDPAIQYTHQKIFVERARLDAQTYHLQTAETWLRQAMTLVDEWLVHEPESHPARRSLGLILDDLASVLRQQRRFSEAANVSERLIGLSAELLSTPEPNRLGGEIDVAMRLQARAFQGRGLARAAQGDPASARADLEHAARLLETRTRLDASPDREIDRRLLVEILLDQAETLGDARQALTVLARAEEWLSPEATTLSDRILLTRWHHRFGWAAHQADQPDNARAEATRAHALAESLAHRFDEYPSHREQLGQAEHLLGVLASARGETDLAREHLERAVAHLRTVESIDIAGRDTSLAMARALTDVARIWPTPVPPAHESRARAAIEDALGLLNRLAAELPQDSDVQAALAVAEETRR